MKRTGYLVMGLILAAVAALYFFQGSEEFEEATYTIPTAQLSIDPARIVRVDIARPDGFVRLERLRGEWKVTEPVFASIDPERLSDLQRGMGEFRLIGLVSTNPRKQRVLNVDEQGTGLVLVSDDGRSLSLVIGKAAPTPGNAFIRPALSDTVYLAHGLTPAVINRELLEWRMRTVYRTTTEAIRGLTITAGGTRHVVQKLDHGWSAGKRTVPPEIMQTALGSLSNIQARGFVDTALILKNRPRLEVEIAAARPVRLELYSLAPDTNYLLKTSLSSAIVVVQPALAKNLDGLLASIAPPPKPVPRAVTPVPAAPPPRAVTTPAPPVTVPSVPPDRGRAAGTTTAPKRQAGRRSDTATRQLEESGNLTVHIVKRGESIISIARKYEVTVEQLKQWNGLQGDNVVPGMEMYVFVKPNR